jgi:uroporphyrinogen-III synthase
LTLATFESRRERELGEMLARHGAIVRSAPALREVPLEANPAAVELLARLEASQVDALVLLTGVGTRALVECLEPRCPRERLAALLARIPLVARGPKPVAALRALGLKPAVVAPEPNTWRELLAALDRELPVRGLRVAVQEYGRTNPDLRAGLEARGATVFLVPAYRWELPSDLAPLRQVIDDIVSGRIDLIVVTTAVQLDHLLQVCAANAGLGDALLAALRTRVAVAAIGPTAREALAARGIPVDIEPEHPKLGYLVAAIAERGRPAVERRRDA